jgi:hypothetical protein
MKSNSPSEFYYELSDDDKRTVEIWRSKRGVLLQSRIQQEVQAKIEDELSLIRNSTPFVRVLVRSCDRSLFDTSRSDNNNNDDDDDDDGIEQAMLTFWSPSEEQSSQLREGAVIRVENLAVRNNYDGLLQLSVNTRTRITPLPASRDELIALGYCERQYVPFFRIHVCSRQLLQSSRPVNATAEYDFVGVVLKVDEQSSSDGQQLSVYLADKSSLVVRVQCRGKKGLGDSIGLRSSVASQCVEHPRVVAFRDLRILPFDVMDNCAVAEFRATSSIRLQQIEPRTEDLKEWAESAAGRSKLQRLAAYMDAGLYLLQRPNSPFISAVGYISTFQVHSSHLYVVVDCGEAKAQVWAFPFHLLQDVVLPNCSNEAVSLSDEDEQKASRLKLLGKFSRARGVLYRFLLKRTPQSITSFHPCAFEVCQMSAADPNTIAALYESLS